MIVLDYTKYCPSYPIKYYKNTMPDLAVIACENCKKIFFEEEYEYSVLRFGKCPFCGFTEGEDEKDKKGEFTERSYF